MTDGEIEMFGRQAPRWQRIARAREEFVRAALTTQGDVLRAAYRVHMPNAEDAIIETYVKVDLENTFNRALGALDRWGMTER